MKTLAAILILASLALASGCDDDEPLTGRIDPVSTRDAIVDERGGSPDAGGGSEDALAPNDARDDRVTEPSDAYDMRSETSEDAPPDADHIVTDVPDGGRDADGPDRVDTDTPTGRPAETGTSVCEMACVVLNALGCTRQPPCVPSCEATLVGKCSDQGLALQTCIASKTTADFVCSAQQRPAPRPGTCSAESLAFATCVTS
ncbi:MAG TPA: hypothetical protein VGF45_07345 [Polyangia bacterium]